MRVAYICADSGVPVFGCKGSSIHVQEIMRALIRRGAEVELFAARSGGEPAADLQQVRMHSLPCMRRGDAASREQAALAANGVLHSELAAAGPFDVVYERYSLWSCAAMEYAREEGTPALLEVNSPLISEQIQHRTLIHRQDAENVAARVLSAATSVIAVSDAVANYVKGFPVDHRCVHVVPNGVDIGRFSDVQRGSQAAEENTFTVGFVGTLKAWHGLPVLVEAFDILHRRDSSLRLLIVGDGPERDSLMADLEARGERLVEAVTFTGAVPPQEIPRLLASMDAAVAPYPPSDNFYFSPLKICEYMAAGLPVVASRVGELERLIEHGENGVLCPPGDPMALAEAIAELRRFPRKAGQLGAAARKTMQNNHTWDAVLGRIFLGAGIEQLAEPVCSEGGI